MKQSVQISERMRFAIYFILAFVQFIVQTGALLKGTEYIVSALTFDDAYYYLQTAWNLKHIGVSSFDGINPTNGFQLLWFGIVYLLAQIAQTKINLLFLSMTTCFFFNSASYLVIWKLSEKLHRPILGVYMSSFWLLLTFGSEFYSTGIENSLHAFIFWLAILQTTVYLQETNERRKQQKLIFLTIILVLNVWARLDAAIFSVLLYIYCISKLDKLENLNAIVVSALLALFGLVIQLTVFYQLGGSWLPVSGLVKQTWSHWGNIFGLSATRLILVLLLLPILEIIIYRYARTKQEPLLRGVWYSLLVGVIIHVIATSGINVYNKFLWYLSPSFIFLTLTLAYFGDGCSQIVSRFAPMARRGVPATFSFALIILSIFFFYVRLNMYIPAYKLGYYSALWISEHSPADVKMASWNAGIIGYFSGRTVINLDGLINGTEYYQQVVNGPKSWMEYVEEKEVDFVIDYGRGYVTSPEFPIVQVFVLPNHKNEVVMWQAKDNTGKASYKQIEFLEE